LGLPERFCCQNCPDSERTEARDGECRQGHDFLDGGQPVLPRFTAARTVSTNNSSKVGSCFAGAMPMSRASG